MARLLVHTTPFPPLVVCSTSLSLMASLIRSIRIGGLKMFLSRVVIGWSKRLCKNIIHVNSNINRCKINQLSSYYFCLFVSNCLESRCNSYRVLMRPHHQCLAGRTKRRSPFYRNHSNFSKHPRPRIKLGQSWRSSKQANTRAGRQCCNLWRWRFLLLLDRVLLIDLPHIMDLGKAAIRRNGLNALSAGMFCHGIQQTWLHAVLSDRDVVKTTKSMKCQSPHRPEESSVRRRHSRSLSIFYFTFGH